MFTPYSILWVITLIRVETFVMIDHRLSQAEQAWAQHKTTLCSPHLPAYMKLRCGKVNVISVITH